MSLPVAQLSEDAFLYGPLILWLLASCWAALTKNGVAFANSGVFLVLFLIISIGSVKSEAVDLADSILEGRLEVNQAEMKIYNDSSRLAAVSAEGTAIEFSIENAKTLIEILDRSADSDEVSKVDEIRSSLSEQTQELEQLQESAASLQEEIDTQLRELNELKAAKNADHEAAKSTLAGIDNLETWLAVYGTIQMTFGSYIFRRRSNAG